MRIPPVLREAAGGNKQIDLEGATVGEILDALSSRFPALRDQLFDDEGRLNRFVNVYLNEEDVRYLRELETAAGPRDTIVVLPAMAGGAIGARAGGSLAVGGRLSDGCESRGTSRRGDMRRIDRPQAPAQAAGAVRERGRATNRAASAAESGVLSA